jgi:hypothetical protein
VVRLHLTSLHRTERAQLRRALVHECVQTCRPFHLVKQLKLSGSRHGSRIWHLASAVCICNQGKSSWPVVRGIEEVGEPFLDDTADTKTKKQHGGKRIGRVQERVNVPRAANYLGPPNLVVLGLVLQHHKLVQWIGPDNFKRAETPKYFT